MIYDGVTRCFNGVLYLIIVPLIYFFFLPSNGNRLRNRVYDGHKKPIAKGMVLWGGLILRDQLYHINADNKIALSNFAVYY